MDYYTRLLCLILTVCLQEYLQATPASGTKITTQALSYMSTYGYYKVPDTSVGQISEEKHIRQAIKRMQRFAGIPVSGIIDDATKKLMKTPRCGMIDVDKNLLMVRKRRYLLQGSKWNKKRLTWKLLNDNNDNLSRDQVEVVMTNAFAKWQKFTNLHFTKLDVSDSTEADIDVKFGTYYHNDAYPFDGPNGTIAHAFFPLDNEGLSGDVHFDDDEYFTIDSPKGVNLLWVAVHEIGHSIGLGHSNIDEAVMYPYYRSNEGKDFDLHEDDTAGIQSIYGFREADPEKTTTTTTTKPVTGSTATTTTTKPVTRFTTTTTTTKPVTRSTTNTTTTKPVSGSSTTTTTTKPKPGVTSPPASQCMDTFKAGFLHPSSQKMYIINNDKAYILGKKLGLEKGPFPVRDIFQNRDSVDAAYVLRDGKITVFKNKMYYVYNDVGGTVLESGTIQNKYGVRSNVKRIDATFIWRGNGRTYLFAGKEYYRFDEARQSMDYGHPKPILGNWKGLPESVDAVFIWRNKVTYFFKDNLFYRFNDENIKVQDGYPRGMAVWTKCQLDREKGKSSSISHVGSTIFTSLILITAKLFQ